MQDGFEVMHLGEINAAALLKSTDGLIAG